MANAPYCNITIATPAANPGSPVGLQHIPQNSTLQQMINYVNNNFNLLARGNFVENRAMRQTTITRIYDPSNPANYVDVRQITGLQFVNAATGQLLGWRQ